MRDVLKFDFTLVFVCILLAFAWRLADAPLTNTEPNRVLPALEMVDTGDWLIPRLFGESYLVKPPLHYWILAASERLSGTRSEWTWRLPSVIASALTAVLLCVASNRWFGRPAGVIAGASFLGLIALWSQNVKADIDANHTLAVVATALGVLDLTRTKRASCWLGVLIGVAFGWVLLLKGPAGLPVVLGAMIGSAIAARRWRAAFRPAILIGLLLGGLLFGSWVLAVYLQAAGEASDRDVRGISEVVNKLTMFDLGRLWSALTLPVVLFVYALPFSLLALYCLRRDARAPFDEQQRRLIGAICATVIAAAAIAMLARIVNPRYMYIVFPLLCPLAGAVGKTALELPRDRRSPFVRGASVIAIIVLGAHLGIVAANAQKYQMPWLTPAIAAVGAVVVCLWTIQRLRRQRWEAALVGLAASMLLLRIPFVEQSTRARIADAPVEAVQVLREQVGVGGTVIADRWALRGLDMFINAGVRVDFERGALRRPYRFTEDRWIVFHPREWARWSRRFPDQFDTHLVLPYEGSPVLAHFQARRSRRDRSRGDE